MEMTVLDYWLYVAMHVALIFYIIKGGYYNWHDDDHRQMHATINAIMFIALIWLLKDGGL